MEDKEDQDYRINIIDKEVQIWLLESRDDLSLSKQLLVRILRRACYFYKLAVLGKIYFPQEGELVFDLLDVYEI